MLVGLALLLDSKPHKEWVKAVGVTIIAIALIVPLPLSIRNGIRYIKEKGIEDYLNGKVQVVITEQQNFYIWTDMKDIDEVENM